ncbi:MAG TPA: hypothetical protein VM900_02810 [Sphingomonas sp.]|jgi:predicted transcriptional regulator|nr:hypothetical protein [Sphingomonas sp.]
MAKAALNPVLVDDSVIESLDRLATRLDRAADSIVAEAVTTFIAEQNDFLDSLDEADRAIARGEFHTQEEVEAWFRARSGSTATG